MHTLNYLNLGGMPTKRHRRAIVLVIEAPAIQQSIDFCRAIKKVGVLFVKVELGVEQLLLSS